MGVTLLDKYIGTDVEVLFETENGAYLVDAGAPVIERLVNCGIELEKLKAVLFYEEEIKNGGMGMNLADIMRYELADRNIKYDILAINDNFATVSKEGQNAYQMAGVDCKIAIDKIMKML